MAVDARKVIKRMSGSKWTKNYYLNRHKDINNKQERRFNDFSTKRWSIASFLGYKYYLRKSKINADSEE
jgi:hypothetical protein